MSERLEKLRASAQKDEERIQKLQDGLKIKKEKIRELENTELMNSLNALSAQGMAVSDIVSAIRSRNVNVLMTLMVDDNHDASVEKSGTSSAFSITTKEKNKNG